MPFRLFIIPQNEPHLISWILHFEDIIRVQQLIVMSLEEEDDFWNSSDVKAFNFDDEDQTSGPNPSSSSNSTSAGPSVSTSTGYKTLGSILAAKSSSNEPFLKPSIIMCSGSDRIEDLIEYLDGNISNSHTPVERQDPKLYIRDIVDKRVPIDFSPYKSKREKLLLLDCAICCSDGNAITAVSIFISKTLKTALFIEEMKKRPIAIDHYVNYLEMTGRSREALEFTKKLSN